MLRSRDRKQERSVSCAKNLVGNVSSCLLFPNSSSIRILTDLVIKTHVFFSQKFHVFYLFICIDDYIKILLHRFACLHKTTLLCKVKLHCWRVVLAMWYWIWGNVLLLLTTWTWTRSVMTLFFQVCIIAWYSMQIKYLNFLFTVQSSHRVAKLPSIGVCTPVNLLTSSCAWLLCIGLAIVDQFDRSHKRCHNHIKNGKRNYVYSESQTELSWDKCPLKKIQPEQMKGFYLKSREFKTRIKQWASAQGKIPT